MQNISLAIPPNTSTSHKIDTEFYFNPLCYDSFASIDFSLAPEDYGLPSFNPISSLLPEEASQETLLSLQLTPFISSPSSAPSLAVNSKKILKKSRSQTSSSKNSSILSPRKRNPWTASEDEALKHLYGIYGPKWAKIVRGMEDRSGKQVRDRYLNALAGNIKKASWTDEEDQTILMMLENYGPQWSRIAQRLEGRTEMQVKNRYYKSLKTRGGIKPPLPSPRKHLVDVKAVEEESKIFDAKEMTFCEDEDFKFPSFDIGWESLRLYNMTFLSSDCYQTSK